MALNEPFEDFSPTKLSVFRTDGLDSVPVKVEIPAGSEFEEVKDKLFKLAFPGNGETPWECKLITIGRADIDDMNVLMAIPDGKVVVDPGPNFHDKKKKPTKEDKERKEREKAEQQAKDKAEKEKEKAEREREKAAEKAAEREKNKEDESDLNRRGSFFDTFRKRTLSKQRSGSGSSLGSPKTEEKGILPRSDYAKVYHKGYLKKKNELLPGGKVPNRNWLSYWVVLRSHYLLFFKERKHYTAQKKPVGGLNIKDCTLEPVFEYKKRDHVFRLKTSRQASYLLEAESLEDMTAWLNYLETSSKFGDSELGERKESVDGEKITTPTESAPSTLVERTSLLFIEDSPKGSMEDVSTLNDDSALEAFIKEAEMNRLEAVAKKGMVNAASSSSVSVNSNDKSSERAFDMFDDENPEGTVSNALFEDDDTPAPRDKLSPAEEKALEEEEAKIEREKLRRKKELGL